MMARRPTSHHHGRQGRILVTVTGLLGLTLPFLLGSCGQPGDDGTAYIAYSWSVGPITFYTEDPAFSNDEYIYNGEYKKTRPGSHYFEYVAWDGSSWYGEYEIYFDQGEVATLFGDGADGEDLYFELACYSFGPSFYVWNDPGVAAAGAAASGEPEAPKADTAIGEALRTNAAERVDRTNGPRTLGPEAKVAVLEGDMFTLILRYQKESE